MYILVLFDMAYFKSRTWWIFPNRPLGLKLFVYAIFFILSFSLSSASAKTSPPPAYPLSPEIQNIRIEARRAHVRLAPLKGPKKTVSLQYEKPMKTEEKDSTFLISEENFPERNSPHQDKKQNKITIKAPLALPITVVLFQGQVTANKLADLSVFISDEGSVRTRNTKGQLNISQSRGNINIHSHKGAINIQAERGKAHLKSCKGDMAFSGFKGRLTVDNSRGQLFVRAFKLPLILNQFTGQLNFRQEQGGVYLKKVTGSVSGYSKEGEVKGLIYPNNVDIETEKGRIHLDMPHSGAYIQADTWEGRLWTPVYFNRIRTGGMDRAHGQLKGRKKVGNVSLKSRSGSIKVYQSAK